MRSTLPSLALLFSSLLSTALVAGGCDADATAGAPDVADSGAHDASSADAADSTDTSEPEPSPPDLAQRPEPGHVAAGVAIKPADLIGGPKAEGRVGDLVLENHAATFLVEAPRPCGGYRQHGGVLVDADLQPGGEDRLGELWLVWNLFAFEPTHAEVVSDGRDGLAVVRLTGRTVPYTWIQALLGELLLGDPIDLQVTYEYRLAPDSTALELVIRLDNDGAAPADIPLPILASNQGDGSFAYAPGPGLDEATGLLPWVGAVGLARAYGFVPHPDDLPNAVFQATSVQIALFNAISLPPGASHTLRFHYVVSDDGTTGIEEQRAALHGLVAWTVSGTVSGELDFPDDQVPGHSGGRSWVAVSDGDDVLALTPVAPDGTFRAVVSTAPAGPVTVQAFAPGRGASAPVEISGERADVALALPDLGELVVRVRDLDGAVIPAQVSVFRVDAPDPAAPAHVRFAPDWGRGRSAVLFHTTEQVSTHLLPGTYRLVASRGYSWELDEALVPLAPGVTETVDLALERAVDTTGWLAADLHLHAYWSPDSDVPYPTRLLQAAANDVALPVFTEHTYLGDIAAHRPRAGVDAWVTPIPGQEVSTVEYGHFNAYPLEYDADRPSGGAVFEHGWPGAALFDAIRAQHGGDMIVQVNHPRIDSFGQAYFNAVELDSATATAAAPDRWTLDWDLIEVFNGRCQGDAGNDRTLEDWFNLNDLGVMRGLSGGSDSHSEAAGLGHPRSWIPVDQAAVAADPAAIIAPLRARRSFVSCGPFVRFATEAGEPTGTLVAAEAGRVSFAVRVEAPSWIAVDRVRVLENGAPVADIDVTTWERPVGLPAGVRFDALLSAEPTADAWYVVEVVGSGTLWPLEPGDAPYAMTNAIEVDADGDGQWEPPATTGATRRMVPRELPTGARGSVPSPTPRRSGLQGHSHGGHSHHH